MFYPKTVVKCGTGVFGSCPRLHFCSHNDCQTVFDWTHRAIQHVHTAPCRTHGKRLEGMNELHPVPLTFPPESSQADTLEACKKYKVNPSLNADFLEETLKKTTIDPDVQASIIRGWREGFDLGSHLPAENHFAKDAKYRTEAQNNTLMKNLEEEKVAGLMNGPMTEPYVDGRWFHNY